MSEPVYARPSDDASMERAIARARESFPIFWRELSWERRRIVKALELAAVKLPFEVPDPQPGGPTAEHMWVDDLTFDGHNLTGTLLNTADHIPGVVAGTVVVRSVADIEDWMYVNSGIVCGGFTVQATRAGLSAEDRAEHDAQWGLVFTAPDEVVLMPAQAVVMAVTPKKRGWAGMFLPAEPSRPTEVGGHDYAEALAEARATEHPMSINSTPGITAQLAAQPEAARTVLDDGWTALHFDAAGGNAGPVAALLQHGADRDARTPAGDTALDLAQRMGWDRVVALLTA